MKNNDLFKIAEVAKFLGVSTTTIRYYEQYGFIKPAKIDEMTGYRYFDVNNISEITHIIDMRQAGLSMRQIKKYFESDFDIRSYISDLKAKRALLDKQIKISELRFLDTNNYSISEVKTKPVYCLTRELVAKDIADIENQLSCFLLETLKKGYVLESDFVSFIEFETLIPQFENIKIKMLIMVKDPTPECSVFPSIHGIQTYHRGTYQNIGNAYDALLNYAKLHNLALKGNAVENYFRSTFNVHDEHNLLTNIILPLKEQIFNT